MWRKFKGWFRKSRDLSPELMSAIMGNWFGVDADLTPDVERRVSTAMNSATVVTNVVNLQLGMCGITAPRGWSHKRPFVLGYVSGLSDSMARGTGEDSKWPAMLICMTSLSFLLGRDWNEEAAYDGCRRMSETQDPDFVAGACSGADDYDALREKRTPFGLAGHFVPSPKQG